MSPVDRRVSTGRPPRPQNSFMLYRKYMLESGELLLPGETKVRAQIMSKRIGQAWKNARDDVRRTFERYAEEERAVHRERYPGYRYHPRSAAEIAWEKEEKQRQREEKKRYKQPRRQRASSNATLSPSDASRGASSGTSNIEPSQPHAHRVPLLLPYDSISGPSPSLSLASTPSSFSNSDLIPITPSWEDCTFPPPIEITTPSPAGPSFTSSLPPPDHYLSYHFGPDSVYTPEGKVFFEAPLLNSFNDLNPLNSTDPGYLDIDTSGTSASLYFSNSDFNPHIYANMLSSAPSHGLQPSYESGVSLPLQEDGFTSNTFHGSEGQYAFDASASTSLSMLLQSMVDQEQSTSQPYWTSYGPDVYPPHPDASGRFD
ncbi:hypothetical protein CPC08DRAFT_824400 [Agrocybe pediades]|nr:hypothetical protein CPC08DRAFT_824400 [Agrocybe pediades]